jgi:hypothetical protein
VSAPDVSPYWALACAQLPRILGLGDRARGSRTFGCFDRNYWKYGLLDFPNARFQEAVALLALLYRHPGSGNLIAGRAVVLEWIQGAAAFWSERRNRDGSVSEVYPGERCFCATAFSFAAVTEAFLSLGFDPDPRWASTAAWLAGRDNREASNQSAASARALFNWFLLSGDVHAREAARERMDALLRRQDAAGSFPEYGGADLGYHTVTLSELMRYQRRAKDDALVPGLRRAVAFVEAGVGPDGRYDAAAGSRRTQFLYPYGLAVLGSDVVARHQRGLAADRVIHPGWLDDRYVIQMATDFLEAAVVEGAGTEGALA